MVHIPQWTTVASSEIGVHKQTFDTYKLHGVHITKHSSSKLQDCRLQPKVYQARSLARQWCISSVNSRSMQCMHICMWHNTLHSSLKHSPCMAHMTSHRNRLSMMGCQFAKSTQHSLWKCVLQYLIRKFGARPSILIIRSKACKLKATAIVDAQSSLESMR